MEQLQVDKQLSLDAETIDISNMKFIRRQLTLADYDDIQQLAQFAYNGHDYIGAKFKHWCEQRDVQHQAIYLVGLIFKDSAYASDQQQQLANHVVAIGLLSTLDCDTTAWLSALRVHPAFRGLQLASYLHQHRSAVAAKHTLFRRCVRVREATGAENVAALKLAKRGGMLLLHECTVLFCKRNVLKKTLEKVTDKLREFSVTDTTTLIQHSASYCQVMQYAKRHANDLNVSLLKMQWLAHQTEKATLNKLTSEDKCQITIGLSPSTRDTASFCLSNQHSDFTDRVLAIGIHTHEPVLQSLLHIEYFLKRVDADAEMKDVTLVEIFAPNEFVDCSGFKFEDHENDSLMHINWRMRVLDKGIVR